nr:uncharacterized protein LOC106692919 isoform X2 [Halyomorpha halys]
MGLPFLIHFVLLVSTKFQGCVPVSRFSIEIEFDMNLGQILKSTALFVVLLSKCNGCSVDKTGRKPVIAALLDLHTGENCELVKIHGLQQLAILRSTIGKMNSLLLPERIEIKLLIFDTCSTTKGTMIATLNALVAAEQTCINTPFFVGFIGNQNRNGLEVSQSISKVFNLAHVIPHSFDLNITASDNAYFVSSYPVKEHTEAVKIMFEKLGIQNFIVLHENNSLSIMKLNHLVDDVKEDLCFLKSVEFVNLNDLKHQFSQDSNEDALLIIIEDVNILDELSGYLVTYSKQIIISAGKIGTENFIFPLLKPTFILQFVSLSQLGKLPQQYDETLVKTYDEQQSLKCLRNVDKFELKCNSSVTKALNIKEKDWTVDLLQYGLMLYGHGLRNVANKKCNQPSGLCSKLNSMSQKQWHHILRDSSTLDDFKVESSTRKINFNMDINGKFVINVLDHGSIRLVGQIEGSKIKMAGNYMLPTLDQKKKAKCQSTILSTSATITLPTTTTTKLQFETSSIPLDGFFNIDLRDYEMIGILSDPCFLLTTYDDGSSPEHLSYRTVNRTSPFARRRRKVTAE